MTTEKTSTSIAGTEYVTFTNAKVPVGHLLGKEDEGFAPIMANFNHERWAMAGVYKKSQHSHVHVFLKHT